jgi:hypothetical protein
LLSDCLFDRSGRLLRKFLEAFALGFGQQEDGDDDPHDADDSGCALGCRQTVPAQEEWKGEDADETADLAHGCGNTVTGSANFHRKDLGRVDERGGIWTELGKEITEAVNNQEGVQQFLNIRNEGEQGKGQCHHAEAEGLNRLASKLIHGKRGDCVARRCEDSEDAELGKCLLQERVVAAEGR